MIKYRIFQNDALGLGRQVCDGMLKIDAQSLLMQLRSTYPDNYYEIEEYNFVPPEGKGIGRDPDLH